jgi:hypothetical protein
VWHKSDIGQIASTLVAMAPTADFAAGVLALASALNAPVRLPERYEPQAVIEIVEVTR